MGEKTYFEMFSGLQKFDMALYFFLCGGFRDAQVYVLRFGFAGLPR